MTDTLLRAYVPLLLWPGLGLLLFRVLPDTFPRLLGRTLYWVGVPLEIFSLIRRASLSGRVGVTPLITVLGLATGLLLAEICWRGLSQLAKAEPASAAQGWNPLRAETLTSEPHKPPAELDPPLDSVFDSASVAPSENRALRGSFTLASMIGNTGFVGLAIAPTLIDPDYLSWIVFYSVAHNIVGSYGLGVFVASYFGRPELGLSLWRRLRELLRVPSLWAFGLGLATRSLPFPDLVETGLERSVWVVIPLALLLMGMRLSQVRSWQSVRLALIPCLIKIGLIPLVVGTVTLLVGLPKPACLAMVLMSGMPSAFANLILAEEYDLDRDLIATAIALSTSLILVTVPLWLWLFG